MALSFTAMTSPPGPRPHRPRSKPNWEPKTRPRDDSQDYESSHLCRSEPSLRLGTDLGPRGFGPEPSGRRRKSAIADRLYNLSWHGQGCGERSPDPWPMAGGCRANEGLRRHGVQGRLRGNSRLLECEPRQDADG